MQVKVVIGTVAFMLTMIVFGYAALREPTRLEEFALASEARQIEVGAELYFNNCASCHGEEGLAQECYDAGGNQVACQGIPLAHAPLLCGDRPDRLEIMSWQGSKEDFVYRTIAAGRGAIMPVWSEQYGGPMRPDQVENVTSFVLNWESEELCSAPPEPNFDWPEVAEYDAFVEMFPTGDAERGAELYGVTYGCSGCHGDMADSDWNGTGPWLGNLVDNAPNRIPEYTPEQYLYESILYPNEYIVDGYSAGIMPGNFALRMGETEETPQDLRDIMAYILGE